MTDSRVSPFNPTTSKARRRTLIHAQFPSVAGDIDWNLVLADEDLFAQFTETVLRADLAPPGSKTRPVLDYDTAAARLRQMLGKDHTFEPFAVAFTELTAGRSVRHVAALTGLTRNRVHRLMRGVAGPDEYDLRAVAKAFRKDPSYFHEWRCAVLIEYLMRMAERQPEMVADYYRRIHPLARRAANT